MSTETEALRRAFERYINPDADIDLRWQAAGYYAGLGVQQSWLDFQAGHAAAKAETADAVAAEREKCAQVCDRLSVNQPWDYGASTRASAARDCAAAIRAGAKSDG